MNNSSQYQLMHEFIAKLLDWFSTSGRKLPWRETRDPYRILVSEIMLQQTNVSIVIPIYQTFLKRFPTIESLAKAEIEEIRSITDQLGYTKRGQYLHDIAKQIVNKYKKFPSNLPELLDLKGIGRYTAGAILSFAFELNDVSAALVDVNVERVLSRLFGLWNEEKNAKFEKQIWKYAEEFILGGNVWRKNQAIMDLGAVICIAKKPYCYICPVKMICRYYHSEVPKMTSLDSFFSFNSTID
ncbi:MAG: A/G-specific adenine glycosylase [Candidatus Hodarchaeales archaeon]|jgi:A/G-specific adenine glycosylase